MGATILTALSAAKGSSFFYAAILAGCILVFLGLRAFWFSKGTKRDALPLPPGPRKLPFIGSALSMPTKESWKTFAKWKGKYGGVIHVSVFSQSIIILNTPKAASDLLEKRSTIYSDRPRLPLLAELTGLGEWNLSVMPYSNLWKKYRRVFTSKFGPGAVQMFDSAHDFSSTMLLTHLSDDPNGFLDHIRLFVAQGIILSTYGIIPTSRDDKYVVLAERALAATSELFRPGAFLVDIFPILRHVPSWVPGASSLKLAKEMKSDIGQMMYAPFHATQEMMSSGTLPLSCFVSSLLEDRKQGSNEKVGPKWETIVSDCALQAYGAGSDTTVASLTTFVLAMALYPDVQKKAQAEVDKIVGSSRLPSAEDRKDLPYITAIMKEAFRWHTTVPLSLPHMLKEDDTYEGYRLPKGSIVLGNSWAILHDAELYPDPMVFRPERYFNDKGVLDLSRNDPAKFAFGYGRRVCPGSFFVENTLHLAISRILATFDISPANGEKVEYRTSSLTGLISHPGSFKCDITPRSEEAASLVRQANENMSHIYKV